jgi:hypothetical protein
MVVAVLFIFLGLNLGILGPGVDDSDGDKHLEKYGISTRMENHGEMSLF